MKVGYLMSRIGNDPQNLQGLMADTFFSFIRSILVFCFGLAVLFYLHWRLALLALVVLPAFVYAVHFFSGRVRMKSGEMQENIGRVFDIIGESLSGIPVIKSFCAEESQAFKVRTKLQKTFRTGLEFAMVNTFYTSLTGLIAGLGPLLVLGYGGLEVIRGNLTLGSFVAFNAYVGYLYGPVRNLMGLNANIQSSLASLKRVFEIFDQPVEDSDIEPDRAEDLPAVKGEITFERVFFSYDGDRPALEDVSFSIEPGEKVALVGRSGAGKSTLVNLIMRFYKPTRGTVRIDGVDISKVRASDVRKHIGIVLQDPFIFAGTVRENIAFGKQDATDDEIVAAARAAYADGFIDQLPNKYETEVGERGVRLSGGERKRIAIARAMLKDPRILILDEATSEVDSESERYIQSALDRLLKGRTTLIIAHRLSTIRNVDKILLIDKGRIAAIGTHDELYASSPLYRTLYDEQFAREDDTGSLTEEM